MSDEATANYASEPKAGTTITEECPNCKGSGRRYRSSAANPTAGEDIGKCLTCNGAGKIAAEGVTHYAPETVKEPTPVERKTQPIAPTTPKEQQVEPKQ